MSSLNGEIRDGRHHMQIRVYYEDTDFDVWPPFRHRIKKSSATFRSAGCRFDLGEQS